jgi:putative DNA primase/helicase
MARRLGWRAQADLDAFPICEPSGSGERTETESGYNDRGREGDAGGGGAFTLSPAAAIALREGTVPEAFNLCTDQANATRLSAQFGHALKCIAGTFYYYSGTHWEKNEGAAARCAANLGAIVKVEADAARAKFESLLKAANEELTVTYKKYEDSSRPEQSKAGKDLQATDRGRELITTAIKANSLEKWQKHCEMLPTQQKALTLLRSLLTLDTAFLDTHHHLFNCPNGTINLITGEVTAHDPKQYITRMAPTSYNPEAKCPEFEKFLVEVLDEERANFLQRWFGYGITGETREQKVVLHIGDGSNGKGTLFRLLDATVGKSYLHTAAPNLLTGDASNRHSTEIADLFGRRMVVAHESDADAALREGFIKQASGEDQLSGRYLYKDHFQFTPTFKLQLLTNHEPTVKGSDFGIWRRLLLVRYAHKYGTAEQVATGDATRLADLDLTARLLAEREGILAWMVAGAREWYATRLRPPASVVNDSALYRTNQDRMRKFVADRCTMDEKAWSPFTNGMGALYPAYVGWCKESGFAAMGLTKFGAELTRAAPGTHTMQQFRKVGGRTKPFTGIKGLRLDSGDIDGSFPITDNGDLI